MVFWLCTLTCSLEAMKTQSKVWGTGDRDDRSKFTDDNESQEASTKIWWNQGEREMGALKNYLLAIFNKQFHSNSIILRKYKCNIHFGIWVVTWRSGEYGSGGTQEVITRRPVMRQWQRAVFFLLGLCSNSQKVTFWENKTNSHLHLWGFEKWGNYLC